MASASPIRLIVGLGNPGRDYVRTRHNAGFMIVDRLASAAGATFRSERKWNAELAEAAGVQLCKPLTYMNLSGRPVRQLCDFYQMEPAQVLIAYDDVALPLGKLRLRPGGSAGGHNGLRSVIEHLGTSEIPRLRLGIGAAAGEELVGHVLGRFSRAEEAEVETMLATAQEAISVLQCHGLAAAMNQFN